MDRSPPARNGTIYKGRLNLFEVFFFFKGTPFNLLVLSNLLQRKPSGRIFLQDVGQEVREARFQPVRGDPLALANVLEQLVDVVPLVRVQTGRNVVTGRLRRESLKFFFIISLPAKLTGLPRCSKCPPYTRRRRRGRWQSPAVETPANPAPSCIRHSEQTHPGPTKIRNKKKVITRAEF